MMLVLSAGALRSKPLFRMLLMTGAFRYLPGTPHDDQTTMCCRPGVRSCLVCR